MTKEEEKRRIADRMKQLLAENEPRVKAIMPLMKEGQALVDQLGDDDTVIKKEFEKMLEKETQFVKEFFDEWKILGARLKELNADH